MTDGRDDAPRGDSGDDGGWGDDGDEWNDPDSLRRDDVVDATGERAGADADGSVAPWETGRGTGGPLRAAVEVVGTVVAAFVLAVVLIFVGFGVVLFANGGAEPGVVELLLVSLLGSQFAFAIASYAYLRRRGESWTDIGLSVPNLKEVGLVLGGLVAVFVLVITVASITQAIGLQSAPNSTAQTAQETPSSALLLIPIAIFVIGPCEELLFRGVVQRRLREVASAPTAIVGASALFAVSHVVALVGDPAAMLVTVLILFVPALVFGVLYEYTRNVVVTSLVHGLYDAVIFGLIYLATQIDPEAAGDGSAAVVDALAMAL